MQTRQVVAVFTIIALALGITIGYGISSTKTITSTTTQTYTVTTSVLVGNSSTTSSSSESFQTSYNLTFTAGGNITACCVSGVRGYNTTIVTNNTTVVTDLVTTSVGDYTVGTQFFYPISIDYNGSWNLVYWIENATGTLTSVKGNLNGSGNYQTTITFYVVGYAQEKLCANATKLDSSQNNLTLTLSVLTITNSTTASNPTAEACATMGV